MRRRGPMRAPDVGRIGAALEGPGRDTRRWCAFVRVETDPKAVEVGADGVWLDCLHVETGEPLRVRWGLHLLPGGGGAWFPPPRAGEELVAVFHEGEPGVAAGLAVFTREWAPLPAAVTSAPNAVHIIGASESVMVTSDKTIDMKATQKVIADAPLVELGGRSLLPIDGLVHGTGIDPFTGANYFVLGNACAGVRGKK
jgi:hypothetical protein